MSVDLTVKGRPETGGAAAALREEALPPAAAPLVRVRGVSFAYGRGPLVVEDVDLDLHAGRVHCLLGDSGSGKSTLLRLVAGLERLRGHHGTITIGDRVVSGGARHVPPEKRAIGLVFQDYALFPHLSVRRNVMFGMRGRPRRQRRAAAVALLDRVGMADFAEKMPDTLSGGQQQRVALARALGRGPEVMLLDEPFTGLDARLRDQVRDVTLEVLRDARVATLMVTHDPHEALIAADAISVMRAGRIIMSGLPHDVCALCARPKGPDTVRLRCDFADSPPCR